MEQAAPGKNPIRARKWVRFLLYTFSIVFLLPGGIAIAILFYQDEIKTLVIKRLNKSLKAEVKIDPRNIDITFIRSFPRCAVEFRDALMLEAVRKPKRDTLMFAARLQMHFNLRDLWQRKYIVHSLTATDVVVKPRVFADGTNNYQFWDQDETAKTDSFDFRLSNFRLVNARLDYRDHASGVRSQIRVEEFGLDGEFSSSNYRLAGKLDASVEDLVTKKWSTRGTHSLQTRFDLEVSGPDYRIVTARVAVDDLKMDLRGHCQTRDGKLHELGVNARSGDLDISELLSLLPPEEQETFAGYQSDGELYVNADIVYHKSRWSVKSDFGARGASVTYLPGRISAENIGFAGHLAYGGGRSSLELKDLQATLEEGKIAGSLHIADFDNPRLTADVRAEGRLDHMHRFFPVDTLEEAGGNVKLDAAIEGELSALRDKSRQKEVRFSLNAQCRDVHFRFRHDDKRTQISSCDLHADNGEVTVAGLRIRRGTSDLHLNGSLPAFVNYLWGEAPLSIKGSLESDHFDFADFISGDSGNESAAGPIIPGDLLLDLRLRLHSVEFGKFRASDVNGLAEIRDRKLMISEAHFSTMEGNAEIAALADNSAGNRLNVTIESTFEKINIRELFRQMNDFGQATLTQDQIRGLVSARLSFSGSWNEKLESDPASIRSACDLTIDRGELIAFSPLKSLGKFIDVKDLERIRFSQLTGKVLIENRLITIPRTAIRNSAMNIDFWGSHSFTHNIDYHFQLLLSDLLAARRKKPAEEEFGPIQRDEQNRRSLFVVMTGDLDNPRIRYDREGLKQKVQNDLRTEKQNMKALLKEEFGMTKEKEPKETSPPPAFRIEETPKPARKTELVLKKKEEEDF